jgi:hypothetical protein
MDNDRLFSDALKQGWFWKKSGQTSAKERHAASKCSIYARELSKKRLAGCVFLIVRAGVRVA